MGDDFITAAATQSMEASEDMLLKRVYDLEWLLSDLLEYFADREDVRDGDYGIPQPNTEMQHASRIREALNQCQP